MTFFRTIFCFTLWGLALEASAWRETGHFAVCEVAYRHLTPQAKSHVDRILGGPSFAEQCTWPDMVRKSKDWNYTYPWHFINVEDGKDYLVKPGEDAATKLKTGVNPEGDVLQAILLATEKLSRSDVTEVEKRQYLRFLGHYTGDAHQPLHIGRRTDLGGNRIKVPWFGERKWSYQEFLRASKPEGATKCSGLNASFFFHDPTGECLKKREKKRGVSLHKVWDLHLLDKFIERKGLKPEAGDSPLYRYKAYATAVDTATPSQIKAWQNSSPLDWVRESLCQRAQAHAVGDGALGEAYYQANIGLVNRRLRQAGYRLAGTLNRIFDSKVRAESKHLQAEEDKLRKMFAALKRGGESGGESLSTADCAG